MIIFPSNKIHTSLYWVVRKVRADVEGKLKRNWDGEDLNFSIHLLNYIIYKLVGTNFPDNSIIYIYEYKNSQVPTVQGESNQ